MKKYILVFALFSLFNSSFLFSTEINKETAEKVAVHFLKEHHVEINSLLLSDPIVINKKNVSTAYIFKFDNGFIIISADNSVFPILGYSFESTYNEKNIAPAFYFWLSQLSEQILINKEKQVSAPSHVSDTWKKYLSEDFTSLKINDGVSPLLNTTWNQDSYYNSAFPTDSSFSSNHPYAGCVATAMGQVMRYYNWPKTGTGQNTISSPYGDLMAIFGNTTYDWAGMETYLDSENPAVADLLYHTAIAVNSEFFPQGTGAYDYNIPPALVDYFDYEETAQFIYRDTYFGDWVQLLRDELENGRPLIYGGIDTALLAGHTFICDGYQDESFFHFNWGWGGQYNGYYYLESLIAGGYHFDFQHDVVIGIEPHIGIMELYAPENLSSEVVERNVNLSWDEPTISGSLYLLGYNIFRNDSLLNKSIVSTTNYTDFEAPPGIHVYRVNTSYIGDGKGRSTEVETFVSSVNEQVFSRITVFPNPGNGKLQITCDQSIQIQSISVSNLSGKEIMNIPVGNSLIEKTLNLMGLNGGVYLLRIKTNHQVFTEKIILN